MRWAGASASIFPGSAAGAAWEAALRCSKACGRAERPAALLAISDAAVVVARSGVTRADQLAELNDTIAPGDDRVLGTVLNMATTESG